MIRCISFIGTRESAIVSEEIRSLYDRAACAAAWAGYTVATGAAKGFDQIAAAGALSAGGKVKLILPWTNYERWWYESKIVGYPGKVEIEVYTPSIHKEWTESVVNLHPNGIRLSDGAFRLHARNFGIISCASQVVAVPNHTKLGGGGTGQGIRIAKSQRKRVFDLTNPADFEELSRRLEHFEKIYNCDLR